MTTDQLRWALADAKRADGSYVLPDSVRVPCDSTLIVDDMGRSRHFHTGVGWADGCLGYTPATDLGAWAKVLYPIMSKSAKPEVFGTYVGACATGETEKVLEAAYSTLQAKGIKLEVSRV